MPAPYYYGQPLAARPRARRDDGQVRAVRRLPDTEAACTRTTRSRSPRRCCRGGCAGWRFASRRTRSASGTSRPLRRGFMPWERGFDGFLGYFGSGEDYVTTRTATSLAPRSGEPHGAVRPDGGSTTTTGSSSTCSSSSSGSSSSGSSSSSSSSSSSLPAWRRPLQLATRPPRRCARRRFRPRRRADLRGRYPPATTSPRPRTLLPSAGGRAPLRARVHDTLLCATRPSASCATTRAAATATTRWRPRPRRAPRSTKTLFLSCAFHGAHADAGDVEDGWLTAENREVAKRPRERGRARRARPPRRQAMTLIDGAVDAVARRAARETGALAPLGARRALGQRAAAVRLVGPGSAWRCARASSSTSRAARARAFVARRRPSGGARAACRTAG